MRDVVISNIKERFSVFNDLAASLNNKQFSSKTMVLKSKSVEDHLWCIVGTRQSYFNALEAGEWQGFQCSLTDKSRKVDYEAAMKETQSTFEELISKVKWSENTERILASLYEHEVMHEGQIIRLIYGLGLEMPASSKWA